MAKDSKKKEEPKKMDFKIEIPKGFSIDESKLSVPASVEVDNGKKLPQNDLDNHPKFAKFKS